MVQELFVLVESQFSNLKVSSLNLGAGTGFGANENQKSVLC